MHRLLQGRLRKRLPQVLLYAHKLLAFRRWLEEQWMALLWRLPCQVSSLQRSARMGVVTRRARAAAGGDSLAALETRLTAAAAALGSDRAPPVSDKHAGCLVPLFEDAAGVVNVWLTRRSSSMRTHAGEVCLPGGRRDEADGGDDAVTALREAHEELGLEPSSAKVICRLPPFLSKHFLSVTPVVARVPADFVPRLNPSEVDAAFHMPLAAFLEAEKHIYWDVGGPGAGGVRYRIHSFDHRSGNDHFVVWGLTASMLIKVAELAFGRPPAFEVNGRGCVSPTRLTFDGQRVVVNTGSSGSGGNINSSSGGNANANSSSVAPGRRRGGSGGGSKAAGGSSSGAAATAGEGGEDEGLRAALG